MAKLNTTLGYNAPSATTFASSTDANAPSMTAGSYVPFSKTTYGSDNGETFTGGISQDSMFGYGGNDTLSGGGGNDRLFGGSGNDTLFGGTGADYLEGGLDADTFVFTGLGESGLTTATADTISRIDALDRIDVPDWMADRAHTAVYSSSVFDSLEQVVHYSQNGIWGDRVGLPDATSYQATLWYNPEDQTGYLLMDMDCDGYMDTGVIVTGLSGILPENYLDTLLV